MNNISRKRPYFLNACLLIASVASLHQGFATPLGIDLAGTNHPTGPSPMGMGSSQQPDGRTISADSRSFFLDGKPWIPIVGEFHYSRYPRAEWGEELLKMKAGGINTVSTYVFWIHHEEEQGKFDWSGDRSLRDFLLAVQATGLKVIVRIGPWDHGEVRNGGFPDWVQSSKTKLRTSDPEFLKLAAPLIAEEAKQMKGLLWKDGGPVIGIQVDNECGVPDYLLTLKKMAQDAGIDVPIYTMTGWNNVPIPKEGLLPLFGGYADGFWGGKIENYRKEFLFSNVRALNDMGAQLTNKNPKKTQLLDNFPYACAEIGAGMMSSYDKRIKFLPADAASLALSKLGSGNNAPGYYMFQGGINPEALHSSLQEDHPNRMPLKDYDFQTALGACGEVREQYHLLRQQHLLLAQFGPALARMPAFFPDQPPRDLKDFDTLRWSVRADDKGSGFLFYNNYQPLQPLPDHADVQFSIRTKESTLLVPQKPLSIPSGSYGIWPIQLDCDGILLEYATAQPLGRVTSEAGDSTYFFTVLEGVRPELLIAGSNPVIVTPGAGSALTVTNKEGNAVSFVVLTPSQGKDFYRLPFAGRERAILSSVPVFADKQGLQLQTISSTASSIAVYPPLKELKAEGTSLQGVNKGLFSSFDIPASPASTLKASVTLEKPATASQETNGYLEESWKNAAEYSVSIHGADSGEQIVLRIHYTGDVARLYVSGKFFLDNFYNGDPMDIPLWRIPEKDRAKMILKILPCTEALTARLPESARKQVDEAKAAGTLDQVTVDTEQRHFVPITP